MKDKSEETKSRWRWILPLVLIIGILVLVYVYSNRPNYRYTAQISGVNVYSAIPLSELQTWKALSLYNSSGKAATTCNFELSAISIPDRKGPIVRIEKGISGIYIMNNRSAYIRGSSEDEILDSCHEFACLIGGITCPEDFNEIRHIVMNSQDINLVLDSRAGGTAGPKAYAELLGALGYLQAILVDKNKDGMIEQKEIDQNTIWIYPYLMQGDTCTLQPFRSIVEILNTTNESRDCYISPAIYIIKSDKNEIKVDDLKIILSGDEQHIMAESIIVRDILSPKWIRAMYGMD